MSTDQDTISTARLAAEVAGQHGISKARARVLVSLAAAELELTPGGRYTLRTAGELEAIVARKIRATGK